MATWHHMEVLSIALVAAVVWLSVVAVVVALCRAAAEGDRALRATAGPQAPPSTQMHLVA